MHRRQFLQSGVITGACASLSGLVLTYPRQSLGGTVVIDLVAQVVEKILVDNTVVPMWQYADVNAIAHGALPVGYVVTEGDVLQVNLSNQLPLAVNFFVPGLMTTTAAITVAPGDSQVVTFIAEQAGSYFFKDTETSGIGQAMGLYGPLIVMPLDSDNQLTTLGPIFDRQYTLVFSELDTQLNAAIANGQSFDMANYSPNYFFVNGLSYPQTTTDSATLLEMMVDENIAIRLINAGQIIYPMHFHGYHVNVLNRNRMVELRIIEKDTVPVLVNECVDVMLPVTQVGKYPLHTHYLPAVTANGVYANGGLLVMQAVDRVLPV